MPPKNISTPWYIFLGGTAFSWLGLAGLSDNIVEWKEWFDIGVMEHWRIMKHWIAETVLFWVPFQFPDWFIDYLVLGGVFIRPYALNMNIRAANRVREEMKEKNETRFVVHQHSNHPAIWIVGNFLVWPASLTILLIEYMRNYLSKQKIPEPQSHATVKLIAWSVLSFIPILFVATDLITTFG
ncbi:MAG: hypothetical protein AB7S99_15040 [Pseudodonghicola sp.]